MSQDVKHNPSGDDSAPTDFERRHSLTSASGAYRWTRCTASVLMISKAPPELRSKYSEEGSQAHRLAERVFQRAQRGHSPEIWFTVDDIESYPAEMIRHIEAFIWYVLEQIKRDRPKKVLVEERLTLDAALNMFGTADICYGYLDDANNRVGRIIDLKYGAGKVVHVVDNLQLGYYACALDETYGRGKGKPFDRVEVTIYQPRAGAEDGPAHTVSIDWAELDDTQTLLKIKARRALNIYERGSAEKNEFEVGEHCDWCAAKGMCPAFREAVEEKSGHTIDELTTTAPAELLPAVLDLTLTPAANHDERVSAIIGAKKDIMTFIKALEDYAMRRLALGVPIPGLKLVETRTKRVWADEAKVTTGLQQLGVDPWVRKLKPITAVQKELGKGGKAMLDDLVCQSRPKAVLVGEDDPRPSIDPVAAAAAFFDDESEDDEAAI